MQFSTLFLISLFSISMALTGCVGSDNSSAPTKPNQPTNPDTNNPNDNTDGDNSSGDGGDNGSGDNPGSGNNGSNDGSNGNGSGDGSTGGNTTPDPVSCNAPDTSIMDTSFGDVGDANKYNIDNYTEVTGTPDLSGTWVIIGDEQSTANLLTDNSLHFFQKYFLVIKNKGLDSYEIANCAGKVETEEIQGSLDCRDKDNNVIDCPDGEDIGTVGTRYMPFTGFLSINREKNGRVNLPIFGLSGLTFQVLNNGYMSTDNNNYIAKKIDNNTNSLGNIMISSLKKHTITKRVYLLELTPEELKSYENSAEDRASIIKGIKPADFQAGTNFLLSTKTIEASTPQSTYSDSNITCITQQVLFSRQCKSEKTDTASLMALASSSSHHFLAAAADKDNSAIKRISSHSKTVEAGDNKGQPSDTAGVLNDKHTNLAFTATETANSLKLSTNTLDKRYESSFIKLCNGTEEDYRKYPSNDCFSPKDDKRKTFKVLIETTYEASNSELDININPSALIQ